MLPCQRQALMRAQASSLMPLGCAQVVQRSASLDSVVAATAIMSSSRLCSSGTDSVAAPMRVNSSMLTEFCSVSQLRLVANTIAHSSDCLADAPHGRYWPLSNASISTSITGPVLPRSEDHTSEL